MGEMVGAFVALMGIGGMVWLGVLANRSLKAQHGSMMKRSRQERTIRESRAASRYGNSSGGMV